MQIKPAHIRYRVLPPLEFEGYVFGVEDVREFAELMVPLLRSCAEESRAALRWRPMNASALVEHQNRGFFTFTARACSTGELVGYCFARRTREGATDGGMYLLPEHRKGLVAVRFGQHVQRGMHTLGAQWMCWECDEASGSRAIPEYLGHRLITRRYVADLTGDLQ